MIRVNDMFWVGDLTKIDANDIIHTLLLALHAQSLSSLLPQPVKLLVTPLTDSYVSVCTRIHYRARILGTVLYTRARRSRTRTYSRSRVRVSAIGCTVTRSHGSPDAATLTQPVNESSLPHEADASDATTPGAEATLMRTLRRRSHGRARVLPRNVF